MKYIAPVLAAGLLAAEACTPVPLTAMDIRNSYNPLCIGVAAVPDKVNGERNVSLAQTVGMNRARADYLVQCVPEASRSRVEEVPITGGVVKLRFTAAAMTGLEASIDRGYAVARPGSAGVKFEWLLADGQDKLVQLIEEDREKKAEAEHPTESQPGEPGKKRLLDKARELMDKYNPFKSNP